MKGKERKRQEKNFTIRRNDDGVALHSPYLNRETEIILTISFAGAKPQVHKNLLSYACMFDYIKHRKWI